MEQSNHSVDQDGNHLALSFCHSHLDFILPPLLTVAFMHFKGVKSVKSVQKKKKEEKTPTEMFVS